MEESKEEIFRKIQEALQNIPENFSILEERIDLDLQLEYFKFSKKVKENLQNEGDILFRANNLFDPEVDDEEKKYLMVCLASLDSVEAFRILEGYLKEVDESLRKWAVLAFQESKMLIETSLLGEQKMFISTGLGGKGDLLRYFAVFIGKDERDFSNTEQKLLKDEFEYSLQNHQSILESIDFHPGYVSVITMIPIRQSIKEIFDNTIKECNQIGNFLIEDMILTNVKVFEDDEIVDIVASKRKGIEPSPEE